MKEIFTITLLIIGALIGAGFASGQEIYSFFYAYGSSGILGIIVTCSLIGLLIYKSLQIIYDNNIENYSEFLRVFIKNDKVVAEINNIMNILLLVTFYIMIAGFGAYFQQEFEINKIIGSAILATLSAIVFFTSVKGVLKVSEFIVPVLLIFIIWIGGINLFTINMDTKVLAVKSGWLLSSILYCSYNMILLIPVLISIKKQIKYKSNIKYIALCCGILMMTMYMLIYMMVR